MNVLGIETSCDETSAAVVRDGTVVLSNVVYSQIAQHRPYGGVVPEIASRSHVEEIGGIVSKAMADAGLDWKDLDAVAVTYGPGLASSLLVGLAAAKALALRLAKPMVPVNHVEAHLFSLFLGEESPRPETACPLVALMVSGGHTALVRMDKVGRYHLLGQTLDDAAGEALDKGANLMKLGYPGGPEIEKVATGGDPTYVKFPRGVVANPRDDRIGDLDPRLCFSFSGLKTALLYYLKDHPQVLTDGTLKHVAASYQEAAFDALLSRTERALQQERVSFFGCVGGVAKNQRLREKLVGLAKKYDLQLLLAPMAYCTDNAAMVAALAGATGLSATGGSQNLDVQPDLTIS